MRIPDGYVLAGLGFPVLREQGVVLGVTAHAWDRRKRSGRLQRTSPARARWASAAPSPCRRTPTPSDRLRNPACAMSCVMVFVSAILPGGRYRCDRMAARVSRHVMRRHCAGMSGASNEDVLVCTYPEPGSHRRRWRKREISPHRPRSNKGPSRCDTGLGPGYPQLSSPTARGQFTIGGLAETGKPRLLTCWAGE